MIQGTKIKMNLPELLRDYGNLFSRELGIDLEKDPFRWFLASVLFGARISTSIAKSTYKAYEEEGLASPETIVRSDFQTLIEVHGRGGYARYDGITAEYMMGICKKILDEYDGKIEKLDEVSRNPRELMKKIQEFRGVGPVTAKIFLRELRGLWENADPEPTSVELLAAKNLGIIKSEDNALKKLKNFWHQNRVKGYDFRDFEAALVRLGLELRRKE